jgi:hypothetical protein
MAHHKRRRPKHQRMRCHCKSWKGKVGKEPALKPSERRRAQDDE